MTFYRKPAQKKARRNRLSKSTNLPIQLHGSHATALSDTNLIFVVEANGTPHECEADPMPLLNPDDFIARYREQPIRLSQPLLVRLNLMDHNGELVRVLCTSNEVGCAGLKMSLPCLLGFTNGKVLAMELFIPRSDKPIPVRGTIRKIVYSSTDTAVRYVAEVDFKHLDSAAELRLASFVHESQLRGRRHLPA